MTKKSIIGVLGLVLFVTSLRAQNTEYVFQNVNSIYDEQNPVVSPDGKTLYFTRSHHPENIGGVADKGDIWYSTLTAERQWSAPKNATRLNNKNWNGVIGFSADGSTIFLYNHYTESAGVVKSQGIAKANKQGNSWAKPVDVNIPYFKNLSDNIGGSITTDGKVLVMSLESFGTKGGEDIYVILKDDKGKWGEPKNLGSTINTRYQEFSPCLSADYNTLYFSSNGHGGRGSSDVFEAKRQGEGWTNWSRPKALDHINTKGREKDYRTYDKYAIYSSTINSDGYSDLKIHTENPTDSISPNEDVIAVQDSIAKDSTDQNVTVAPVVSQLYGKVFDSSTKELIEAIITIEGNGFNKETPTAEEDGGYAVSMPAAGAYQVRVDAVGYISKRENLKIEEGQTASLQINYILQPITVGTTVNLENVLFQQSTPNILESSYPELDLVVDLMKQNPSMKIRLEGHTDNKGVPKHNLVLSRKRAEAVQLYLVKRGISAKRISWKGYGGTKPIADNDDPKLRMLNRRVEFTIVKE